MSRKDDLTGLDDRLAETQKFVWETLLPRVKQLEQTVEQLETENKRLRARLSKSGSKEEKVADIVTYADNARGDRPAVKLSAKELVGAAGISRRYAYDLMDELPQEFDWFLTPGEMTQYGSIEIDNADERRLGVDFEGVHSEGCPVNKFTTPNRGDHA